ncbi:MAG: twin-arginine translocase TatA/TatE family subunit [Gemmatimonadetes bacterium]|nr:twin-arginine translocase TatA/TatE family subunit [Gemmatimonadota bacterium]
MGNLGFTEIMLIVVALLLLFGAKRLPEIGGSIGKGIREFKRSLSDAGDSALPPSNPSNQFNAAPRQLETPPSEPPAQGGPKRLSQ